MGRHFNETEKECLGEGDSYGQIDGSRFTVDGDLSDWEGLATLRFADGDGSGKSAIFYEDTYTGTAGPSAVRTGQHIPRQSVHQRPENFDRVM